MNVAKRIFPLLFVVLSFNAMAQTNADSTQKYTYNKQYTYLDALRLDQILDSNRTANAATKARFRTEWFGILARYNILEDSVGTHPFLKKFVSFGEDTISGQGRKGLLVTQNFDLMSMTEKPAEKIIPTNTVPMNWEAAVINGLATFMAGRFKQEILHMGINSMFDRLRTRDSLIVASLFPKTIDHIITLQDEGSGAYYTADLLYLRELVNLDFKSFPKNFSKNMVVIFPKLEKKPNIRDAVVLAGGLVSYAEMGVPLDKMLTYVSEEDYSSDSSYVSQLVNITDLFSLAFRDKDGTGRTWINPLVTLPHTGERQSKTISSLFYGLLYSQLSELEQFKRAFKGKAVADVSKMIQDISVTVNKLDQLASLLKSDDDKITNVSQGIAVLDELLEALESTSSILNELKIHTTKFDSIMSISSGFLNFSESIIAKEYRRAIPQLVAMFAVYSDGNSLEISRALGFISGLGAIEDEGDMENLLQAYALPIGSASIKRSSHFNLSINGYVGFTGGIERAFSLTPQNAGNIGLTAPIGLSMTFFKGNWTLFGSVIDLGSVVNQRLNNDSTSYVDFRFEQFFAPGLGLYYNFKNTPITLGVHAAYIPNLRTISYQDGMSTITATNVSVLRLNASLLIDIPFFTLYNDTDKINWRAKKRKQQK